MKTLKLQYHKHDIKIGKRCDFVPPTVTESCLLEYDGQVIGFYLTDLPDKLKQYISIANKEFLSKNVPKSLLERSDVYEMQRKLGISRKEAMARNTVQMSTILGAVLAKPHLRRPYNSVSAVHTNKKAKTQKKKKGKFQKRKHKPKLVGKSKKDKMKKITNENMK